MVHNSEIPYHNVVWMYGQIQAVSGSIGGIASACVTNPLEMLRIRLQVIRGETYFNILLKEFFCRFTEPTIQIQSGDYGDMRGRKYSRRYDSYKNSLTCV